MTGEEHQEFVEKKLMAIHQDIGISNKLDKIGEQLTIIAVAIGEYKQKSISCDDKFKAMSNESQKHFLIEEAHEAKIQDIRYFNAKVIGIAVGASAVFSFIWAVVQKYL